MINGTHIPVFVGSHNQAPYENRQGFSSQNVICLLILLIQSSFIFKRDGRVLHQTQLFYELQIIMVFMYQEVYNLILLLKRKWLHLFINGIYTNILQVNIILLMWDMGTLLTLPPYRGVWYHFKEFSHENIGRHNKMQKNASTFFILPSKMRSSVSLVLLKTNFQYWGMCLPIHLTRLQM